MYENYRVQTFSLLIGERLNLLDHEAEPRTVIRQLLYGARNSGFSFRSLLDSAAG